MRHQEKLRTPNKYNYNRSQSQTVELLSATLKIVANKQINPILLCVQVVQVVLVPTMMTRSAEKRSMCRMEMRVGLAV
jgi:hypothetical protein